MMAFTLQCSGNVAVAATTVADMITVFGTGKSVRDARPSHAVPAPFGLPGETMDVPFAAKPRLAPHWFCRFPVTQSGPYLCVGGGVFCWHSRFPPIVTRLISEAVFEPLLWICTFPSTLPSHASQGPELL